ncbi:MAG: hypothetical protein FNP40_05700 [Dehalobacter sp. 4CP]|nr:hypothetical protein [Dehalobacter sp. 4CP]
MQDIVAEGINSFASPIVTVPASFLQALQSLQDEIAALKGEQFADRQEIAALRLKLASLEKDRDTLSENQLIQLRLIHGLKERRSEPTHAEVSRAERIERYLAARSDHRATYATLRGILGVDKDLLNGAIGALLAASPGKFKIVRVPGDRRKRALIMLPK